MSGSRESRTFEQIIDICIDEISMGRMSVEDSLDRWPEHREELVPLLSVSFAIRELPEVAEHAPGSERRADFLSAIRTTPQDAPTARGWIALPSLGSLFGSSMPRLAAAVAPAAAVAIVASALTLSSGATTASASTLPCSRARWSGSRTGAGLRRRTARCCRKGTGCGPRRTATHC